MLASKKKKQKQKPHTLISHRRRKRLDSMQKRHAQKWHFCTYFKAENKEL